MPPSGPPLSIVDLSSAGLLLYPQEAVALILELGHLLRDGSAGADRIEPERIWLWPDGRVELTAIQGDGTPEDGVAVLGALLDACLAPVGADMAYRPPPALRLAVARAIGTIDLPAFVDIDEFLLSIARFGPDDPAEALRTLYARTADELRRVRWRDERRTLHAAQAVLDRPAATELKTLPDVRRARRRTRLTLAQIAALTGIPAPLLRDLEWGCFDAWPTGECGEEWLRRYARAAGLDADQVIRVLAPMLAEQGRPTVLTSSGSLAAVSSGVESGEAVGLALSAAPSQLAAPRQDGPAAPVSRAWAFVAVASGLAVVLSTAAMWPESAGAPGVTPAAASQGSIAEPVAAAEVPVGEPLVPLGPGVEPVAEPPGEASDEEALATPADLVSAATAGQGTGPLVPGAVSPTGAPPAAPGTAVFVNAALERVRSGRRSRSGGAELHVLRIADRGAQAGNVRLSPNGRFIAFDSNRDGTRGVYIARRDGSNVRRISGDGFATMPNWSPDGTRLSLVRAEPGRPHVWNLWVFETARNRLRRITSQDRERLRGASWFPDGRRLCYASSDRLVIVDSENGETVSYPSPQQGRPVRTPAVSPDGKRIAFKLDLDGLWLLELEDGTMRRILEDPTADEFAWSPESQRLAFHSRKTGEWGLWVMASDGPR